MNIEKSKWSVLSGLAVGVVAVFGLLAAPAFAQDLLSKAVNDPSTAWGTYGTLVKSELVKDAAVTGGTAERVTLTAKGANAWDAGAHTEITKPLQKGDVLQLAFWAKAHEPPKGSDAVDIVAKLQETAAPYVALSQDTPIHIGAQWKLYYVSGSASKDYLPSTAGAALQLATGEQVIDFGPVFILDFGQGYDVSKLPHN
jgi:hypothetical protein